MKHRSPAISILLFSIFLWHCPPIVVNRCAQPDPATAYRGFKPSVTTAVTRNFFDNGRTYEYRTDNGIVNLRIDGGAWAALPNGNPKDSCGNVLLIENIAADNNRLFAIALSPGGQRELWWYCVKDDQAEWSAFLINVLGNAMKAGYKEWTTRVHKAGTWTNLLELREFEYYLSPDGTIVIDSTLKYRVDLLGRHVTDTSLIRSTGGRFIHPKRRIDVNDVADIAVGDWGGTVVTYYVLLKSTGIIRYIDEEIVMGQWQTVPRIDHPGNSPYRLDSTSRIEASNSVVCATKPSSQGTGVCWIRWDFHNPLDFTYWPGLDWCEHGWHSTTCPARTVTALSFDTHGPADAGKDGAWPVPKTAWGVDYRGFLGHMNRADVPRYPVALRIRESGSCEFDYSIPHSDSVAAWLKNGCAP